MENSTDPEFLKRQFDSLQSRLRQTGVGGVTLADGIKSYGEIPEDKEKTFEERKNLMKYENGVASLGVKKRNVPQARPRKDIITSNNIKIFSIGEAKPKDSKEK